MPSGLPLLGMLFFGNLLKESGVTRRLAETARGPLIDTITILLGLTVGASTQASEFLTKDSIFIFFLGAVSFIIATASGVIFVKIFNLVLKKENKINPLIGNAGVSAVPDSARISQVVGLEYDPSNYLLMHAMGPNVAGVIGSAVAATEHHVGGVDDVPVMSQIGWFRSESFHWCTFSCLLCSGLGLPRWSGLAVSASLSVGSLKVLDGEWESALKDPLGKHNNPL